MNNHKSLQLHVLSLAKLSWNKTSFSLR